MKNDCYQQVINCMILPCEGTLRMEVDCHRSRLTSFIFLSTSGIFFAHGLALVRIHPLSKVDKSPYETTYH